jgi:signal transduction protein with GAF and PtsI domain
MTADSHAGHQIAGLTGRVHPERTMVGRLVCLDCEAIIRPLRLCGEMTKAGKPCHVPIREDLGYESCWSHGEGRGRTSTPRRWPPTSWGAGWQAAGARGPYGRGA